MDSALTTLLVEEKALACPLKQDLTSTRATMTLPIFTSRVQILKQKYAQSLGLPFHSLLSESMIEAALDAENISYRQRLFSPFVTLWAFLSQVLDADKSCSNAVSRVIARDRE